MVDVAPRMIRHSEPNDPNARVTQSRLAYAVDVPGLGRRILLVMAHCDPRRHLPTVCLVPAIVLQTLSIRHRLDKVLPLLPFMAASDGSVTLLGDRESMLWLLVTNR